MSYFEALDHTARLWGIESEYWDIGGVRHQTRPEVQRAILKSLGVSPDSEASLDQAAEAKLWREWSRLTPSTLVVSQPGAGFPLSTPPAQKALIEIRWEQGGSARYECDLEQLPVVETVELGGQQYQRRMAPLPRETPLGYHEIEVAVGPLRSLSRLIVAPQRAWLPPRLVAGGKAAGVAISLYGLRSRRDWGCGDLGDLERFIDWAAQDLHVAFVALNPLHAIQNRQPFNTSPYLPNSVFYRNPIYLDIERLEDFRQSQSALTLLEAPETQAELATLRSSQFVEYERVYALKLRFLRLCFESSRAAEFQEYCEREGELLDIFATCSALDEWIHQANPDIWIWPDWPAEYRDPGSEATRRWAQAHQQEILFYKYMQWQLDEQLGAAHRYAIEKGLSIGLYHDLALATDSCGSDLWGHHPFFIDGCRVGSPPDGFAPKGQNWGFPPPSGEQHHEDGYRLFAESIRHNARHGGALRIDHVMRFSRLFCIPEGMEACDGAYLRQHQEDLLSILALESVRQKFLIVGEDLGTVEPQTRKDLERRGVLSYRLLYFERENDGSFRSPESYPRQALVSSTTHDLATLAGFWTNRDIEARRSAGLAGGEEGYRAQLAARAVDKQRILDALFRAGLLPEWFPRRAADVGELVGELHNAVIGFLARTPSMLLLVNQEDLTKETEQQNLPGSTCQYPNWRRKMKFSVDELQSSVPVQDFAAMFRGWLEKTGRTSEKG